MFTIPVVFSLLFCSVSVGRQKLARFHRLSKRACGVKIAFFLWGSPKMKKNLFLPPDFLQPKCNNIRGDARGLDNQLLRINPTVLSAITVAWAPPSQNDEVGISINPKQTPDIQQTLAAIRSCQRNHSHSDCPRTLARNHSHSDCPSPRGGAQVSSFAHAVTPTSSRKSCKESPDRGWFPRNNTPSKIKAIDA